MPQRIIGDHQRRYANRAYVVNDEDLDQPIVMSEKGSLALLVLVLLVTIANLVIVAIVLDRTVNLDVGPADPPSETNGSGSRSAGTTGGSGGIVVNVGTPGGAGAASGGGDGGGGGRGSGGGGGGQRTYLIAHGSDYGAYDYIDTDGFHRGFNIELVAKVCEAASVKCETVYDTVTNCFTSDPDTPAIMGPGLQNEYYDGCVGWSPTVQRLSFAKFSLSYVPAEKSVLFYKAGSTFDPEDFTNKKVGFIAGWASDYTCLSRSLKGKTGIPLPDDQIITVLDASALNVALQDGDIDVAFSLFTGMQAHVDSGEVEYVEDVEASCVIGGDALATKKNSGFIDLWNAGFSAILSNGVFSQLCKDAASKYGAYGTVMCVDSYDIGGA